MNQNKRDYIQELIEECIDCGACSENCMLLQEIALNPASIASRGAEIEEAFGCSLCKLCEAVCPVELSPAQMFQLKRINAVAKDEIEINEFRYLFPDRPKNVMSFFREYYGIHYDDLNQNSPAETAFFPGCTMMTYSPGLTRKVYETLSEVNKNLLFLTDCCGKPLYQLGLESRWKKNNNHIKDKVINMGIKKLIVACPNCFYELRKTLADQEIEIVSVYEILEENNLVERHENILAEKIKYTIHDSCPDRFEGILGTQVRKSLEKKGYQVIEMDNCRERTICCGSGGQISHFRPDFASELVEQRLKQAEETNTGILVAFCHSCVLNFGRISSGVKVRHALNLLLDFDEDYSGVKNKAKEIFEGPDGAANWQKVMAEPGEE